MIYISAHPHNKGQHIIRRQVAGRISIPGQTVRVGLRAASLVNQIASAAKREICVKTIAAFTICSILIFTAFYSVLVSSQLFRAQRSSPDSAGKTGTGCENQGNKP